MGKSAAEGGGGAVDSVSCGVVRLARSAFASRISLMKGNGMRYVIAAISGILLSVFIGTFAAKAMAGCDRIPVVCSGWASPTDPAEPAGAGNTCCIPGDFFGARQCTQGEVATTEEDVNAFCGDLKRWDGGACGELIAQCGANLSVPGCQHKQCPM